MNELTGPSPYVTNFLHLHGIQLQFLIVARDDRGSGRNGRRKEGSVPGDEATQLRWPVNPAQNKCFIDLSPR